MVQIYLKLMNFFAMYRVKLSLIEGKCFQRNATCHVVPPWVEDLEGGRKQKSSL
jgi:hypothetical protein